MLLARVLQSREALRFFSAFSPGSVAMAARRASAWSFYPYASLVLTIRRREDVVFVRFSDLLQRAPLPVLEGAAALLLSRVYRRKAPRALVEPYLNYARSNRTRSRISRMRRGRVRLASTGPRGRHFDLEKMFEQLNEKYFSGSLQRPHIGWSMREAGAANSAATTPAPIRSC